MRRRLPRASCGAQLFHRLPDGIECLRFGNAVDQRSFDAQSLTGLAEPRCLASGKRSTAALHHQIPNRGNQGSWLRHLAARQQLSRPFSAVLGQAARRRVHANPDHVDTIGQQAQSRGVRRGSPAQTSSPHPGDGCRSSPAPGQELPRQLHHPGRGGMDRGASNYEWCHSHFWGERSDRLDRTSCRTSAFTVVPCSYRCWALAVCACKRPAGLSRRAALANLPHPGFDWPSSSRYPSARSGSAGFRPSPRALLPS